MCLVGRPRSEILEELTAHARNAALSNVRTFSSRKALEASADHFTEGAEASGEDRQVGTKYYSVRRWQLLPICSMRGDLCAKQAGREPC